MGTTYLYGRDIAAEVESYWMVPLLVESETDKLMNWQLASAEPLVHWVNADEVTQTLEGDWGVMDSGEDDEYRVGLHYWSGLPRSKQEDGTIQFGPITIKTGPEPEDDD